jgi:hypothetical protein
MISLGIEPADVISVAVPVFVGKTDENGEKKLS